MLKYWCALLRTPGVGSKTFLRLIEASGDPEAIFQSSYQSLKSLRLHERSIAYIRAPDWQQIDEDLKWAEQAENTILTLRDKQYPTLLSNISDPPPVLFVKGTVALLSQPQVAIVGSRNPSESGLQTASEFAYCLSHSDLIITSGMALGIDAASHQGCLRANGATIAVMGTGLDRVYPASHQTLAHSIVAQGALVSEFPLGTPAKAGHFPKRNRIISGLSMGLLVVEAAMQSGSLISARSALEQGREVFAIPGSIHNPLARGCNALIKEGAKLVETSDDILQEIGHFMGIFKTQHHLKEERPELEPTQEKLLNCIDYAPTSIDTLVEKMSINVEVISSLLLILELQGYISSVAGGCYIRI